MLETLFKCSAANINNSRYFLSKCIIKKSKDLRSTIPCYDFFPMVVDNKFFWKLQQNGVKPKLKNLARMRLFVRF